MDYRPGPFQGRRPHAHAFSAASASIVIAPPPPVSLAARNRNQYSAAAQDTLRRTAATPTDHLRADSCVLGNESPRIMNRAHVPTSTTTHTRYNTNTNTPAHHHRQPHPAPRQITFSTIFEPASPQPAQPAHPQAPPVTTTPFTISSPVGAPFYPKAEDYGGYQFAPVPQRLSARMPLEIRPRAHWLSRLRSCLRLLIIVLSGGVVFMLMHTLSIYRGNRYLELRKGEIPMVWPAHTNLAPTIILTAIAGINFLASVAILALSFKRSFRRPIRSRDLYRIVAGSCGVVLWAVALTVFHLLDRASKASLGRYSCTNQAQMTNGRYQYRAVCEEQSVAFWTAVSAGGAELLTLLTLAASAIKSMRDEPPLPTIQIHEKKNSNHLSTGWRPTRGPKTTWIQ
ncbi:hypothetical protein E8E13_007058 [Curvularia kusanoi]|uniref:Uncharacterized protein n=1 Tax=Curvularia kusanoi TaxID=90978 RepID=A0A9P4W986_CURKU|nr:hypothetical protein E8E13_007058 [Curvularia kusanoi]